MRRILRVIGRTVVFAVAAILILAGVGLGALETSWGKNQIRQLIVRQANQYLTGTLEIGRVEGSIFRGIHLSDIRLSTNGEQIISVDDVLLQYSIRELLEPGVVVRAVRLERLRVIARRQPDGRWNLGALVRRQVRQN